MNITAVNKSQPVRREVPSRRAAAIASAKIIAQTAAGDVPMEVERVRQATRKAADALQKIIDLSSLTKKTVALREEDTVIKGSNKKKKAQLLFLLRK